MNSLQACLLVASPDLPDPFARAVVLLIRHNAESAVGLILNRRTSARLKETWNKLSQTPCRRRDSIFLGGPCEGPLVALHTREDLSDTPVMPGLYFSAGKDKLESLAGENAGPPIKFFAGYSGWAAGQLEGEIARGSWSVMPALPEHVFQHEDDLWSTARKYVADVTLRAALNIKHSPADPRYN